MIAWTLFPFWVIRFINIQTVDSYEYAHKNPKYLSLTNVFVALYLKFITA